MVHRLDKQVSGVILFARNIETTEQTRKLAAALRGRIGEVVPGAAYEVALAASADWPLKRYRGIVASSDSVVLDCASKVLDLPRERLYASVFAGEGNLPRDDEAIALWKKVGLPESRIVALGRKDNFWGPAGGRGACGPSSEIYFDLGERRPDHVPADAFWGEAPGDEGDRFMEFWNLVFPQFDAQADGTLAPLPRPGIDTGMGLERLSLIMQGKASIFETDVFAPLVAEVMAQTERRAVGPAAERDARIVADHVRALTFAVAEGALPGNEGAGYVLRRILRRAARSGSG